VGVEGYTSVEYMICMAARLIEDSKTMFIGYGMPQIAAILAQQLYAPNICQVYEYGAIGPEVATPFRRNMMADARNSHHAVCWTNMNTMVANSAAGFIDYGILGAAQIDRFGNLNSTCIGDYWHPSVRFSGSGGGGDAACLAAEVIIFMQHEKRRFVEKVDYLTTPGWLSGPGARGEAGLYRGGPSAVVTNLGVMRFDEKTKEIYLYEYYPGVLPQQVRENTGFEIDISRAIEARPLTNKELRILREEVDPQRLII